MQCSQSRHGNDVTLDEEENLNGKSKFQQMMYTKKQQKKKKKKQKNIHQVKCPELMHPTLVGTRRLLKYPSNPS